MSAEEKTIFKSPRQGSNTNFIPRKMINKRPTPPRFPPTPYMRFSKANIEKLLEYYPDSKPWNVGRLMGQLWRELPEKEKLPYFEAYKAAKTDFDKKFKSFYTATSKNCYSEDQEINMKDSGSNVSNIFSENEELYIEPAEDEEDFTDESFTEKHKAYARFVKNNLLMKAIFSNTKSSNNDILTSISTERLERLKKSRSTLEAYLKKRMAELHVLQQMHEQQRMERIDSNTRFQKHLRQK